MTTPKEVLLKTLNQLGKDDFDNFKLFLNQEESLRGFKSMPKCQLEDPSRFSIVDKMVQFYETTNAIEVTEMVLVKMNKTELLKEFKENIKKLPGTETMMNQRWGIR